MKTYNFIFGALGFAKEVDWLINDIYVSTSIDYRPHYFVVPDTEDSVGQYLNNIPIINESKFFSLMEEKETSANVFIGIGSPNIRKKIVSVLENLINCHFPNLIHPDVTYDKRADKVKFGKGIIICSKNVLTTDISIGNFVHINIDCTVGHDSTIGNYCTLSPGVHVSGNVNIDDGSFVGTGAVILEKIYIGSNIIIGAGAVVVKNLKEEGVYIGTPARKLSK